MKNVNNVWNKEKIGQLVVLYKENECLWNHYKEDYKCKDLRKRTVDRICSALGISRLHFGKKIHNLRNQFNVEMKKLEQSMRECGCSMSELNPSSLSRWEHFDSLMFLRDVIEPRFARFPSTYKKMRPNDDCNIENDSIQQINNDVCKSAAADDDAFEFSSSETADDEIVADQEEFDITEFNRSAIEGDDPRDEKYKPLVASPAASCRSNNVDTAEIPASAANLNRTNTQNALKLATGTDDVNQSSTNVSTMPQTSHPIGVIPLSQPSIQVLATGKDQWDTFGELVATEFRNLNSDVSRKKLKRKIMLAMLEVGEEDDNVA